LILSASEEALEVVGCCPGKAICARAAGHPRPLAHCKVLNRRTARFQKPTQMAIPLLMDEIQKQLVAAMRRARGQEPEGTF
jgi:hypothetical protein